MQVSGAERLKQADRLDDQAAIPSGSRLGTPAGALCALTHTAHPAGVQFKVLGAVAEVAARGIDTQAVDTVHWVCTLVDICGVGAPSAGSPPSVHVLPQSSWKTKALDTGG